MSGQKAKVRTLERAGTKLICDWSYRQDSRQAADSLETRVKGRAVHSVNCGNLKMRKHGVWGETYRAERTVECPAVSGKPA